MVKHILARHLLPLTAVVALVVPALAQPSPPSSEPPPASSASLVFKVEAANERLEMTIRTSRILVMDQKITQAQVNNPDMLVLAVLSPHQIQVSARGTGVTQVNLWGEDKKLRTVDVIVFGDVQELAMILRATFPNAALKVVPVASAVLISGFVDKPEHIERIVRIAEEYYPKVINNMTLAGVQQVLLHVKVMEVSRTKLRRLGFDFGKITGSNVVTSGVGGLLANALDTSKSLTQTLSTAGDNTFAFGVVNGNSAFYGFLDALDRNDLLKIRAEPNVVACNGQQAAFNAGGQIPVPVPQSLGTTTIEWKDYGAIVRFVPFVLGNGKIRLEVRPEISELDDAHSILINGTQVPGLLTRWAQTTVEMEAGDTFAIAGLVLTRSDAHTSGLPWVCDVPYLGVLFRNVREERNEIELLILITPELVEPLSINEVPPCGPGSQTTNPSDWELYMKGYLEVPKCCPNGEAGNGNCPLHGSGIAPPSEGMILGPGEQIPAPQPSDATSSGGNLGPRALARYNRYAPSKPNNPSAEAASAAPNNPPGFIGPVGYDVK